VPALTTNQAELISTTYDPVFAECLFRDSYVLNLLNSLGKVETMKGKTVNWKAHYSGNSSVGSYGETDAFGGAGNQAYKDATLTVKLAKVELEVSGLHQKATETGGVEGIADAWANEVEEGLEDLKDDINDMLYADGTGNSGKDIPGIPYFVQDTGTVAGLDTTTYTWFASYIDDNSGTPRNITALSSIEAVVDAMFERKSTIDLILTNSTQWRKVANLIEAEGERVTTQALAGGAVSIDWEGTPIVKIPGYPGRMDFLRLRDWKYRYLTMFEFEALGKTKDSNTGFIKHYGTLQCRNPYMQAAIIDLN